MFELKDSNDIVFARCHSEQDAEIILTSINYYFGKIGIQPQQFDLSYKRPFHIQNGSSPYLIKDVNNKEIAHVYDRREADLLVSALDLLSRINDCPYTLQTLSL